MVSCSGLAIFASVVLPGAFGERMRVRACVHVRGGACWRGVAGQQAATAGAHSSEKEFLYPMYGLNAYP